MAVPRPVRDRPRDTGASLVEFALLLALIAIVSVAAMMAVGAAANAPLSHVGSTIP